MITQSLRRGLRFTATIISRTGSFDVMISPIDALDPFLLQRFQLEAPLQYRQAFIYTDEEVEAGMYLRYDDKEYPIKGISPYPDDDGNTLYMLVLENLSSL